MKPVNYSVKVYDLSNKELNDISKAIAESTSRKHNFALWTVVAVSAFSIVGLPIAIGALIYEQARIDRRQAEALKNLKKIKDLQIKNDVFEPTIIGWKPDGTVSATLGEKTKALRREAQIQNFGFPAATARSTQTSIQTDNASVASDEYYDSFSELHPLITFPDES